MGNLFVQAIVESARNVFLQLDSLPLEDRVEAINAIREELHAKSPFASEPVDCVRWVKSDLVQANDYNPNQVAPPEMRLLALSILADGYTQPIVANREGGGHVVIDGFHRNRIGKEHPDVKARVMGYLPVVQIRSSQAGEEERMASTIRHNRARGKHAVEPMTGLVAYLAKRNWDDAKIGRELGMEQDEVLRFKQVSGLTELFADKEFSEAWDLV